MSITEFCTAVQSLKYIPAKDRKRAIAISMTLQDSDRNALIADLQESNEDLENGFQQTEQALKAMESFAAKLEKDVRHFDQQQTEEHEHTDDTENAEQLLSNAS